ncbi:MAG: HigA family addiction module antitoxin [Dehalococcoidia bacterium]|nr:HigA family addiction module antitoxin [Dehalococcoidia bacterium]
MIEEERLPAIHPGEILTEEFLAPMGISPYKLAKDIGVPQTQVSQIIHGKRSITPRTAVRLGLYFGNSTEFWLNLQRDYDLELMDDERPAIRVKRPDGTDAVYNGRRSTLVTV